MSLANYINQAYNRQLNDNTSRHLMMSILKQLQYKVDYVKNTVDAKIKNISDLASTMEGSLANIRDIESAMHEKMEVVDRLSEMIQQKSSEIESLTETIDGKLDELNVALGNLGDGDLSSLLKSTSLNDFFNISRKSPSVSGQTFSVSVGLTKGDYILLSDVLISADYKFVSPIDKVTVTTESISIADDFYGRYDGTDKLYLHGGLSPRVLELTIAGNDYSVRVVDISGYDGLNWSMSMTSFTLYRQKDDATVSNPAYELLDVLSRDVSVPYETKRASLSDCYEGYSTEISMTPTAWKYMIVGPFPMAALDETVDTELIEKLTFVIDGVQFRPFGTIEEVKSWIVYDGLFGTYAYPGFKLEIKSPDETVRRVALISSENDSSTGLVKGFLVSIINGTFPASGSGYKVSSNEYASNRLSFLLTRDVPDFSNATLSADKLNALPADTIVDGRMFYPLMNGSV